MRTRKMCTGPECDRPANSRGMCRTHARQRDKHGRTWVITERARPNRCEGPECTRDATNRGYCRAHRQQLNRGQTLEPIGAKQSAPRPERRKEPTVWGDKDTIAQINRSERRPSGGTNKMASTGPVRQLTEFEIGSVIKKLIAHDAIDLADMLGLEIPQ